MTTPRKPSAARTKPGRAKAPAKAQGPRPKGKAGASVSPKAKVTTKVAHPVAKGKIHARPGKPAVPAKGGHDCVRS